MRLKITQYFLLFSIPLLLPARTVGAPIAKGSAKFLGNITASRVTIPSNFKEYWNQITPENSGKWGVVERSRDSMSWNRLDSSYLYAKNNGMLFKEHTLVWGSQEPSWIDSLTADEQREEVEEWIQALGERYPDADFIDVVNEPINQPASYRDALGGSGASGWDWVVWTFEKARQYFPNANLLINEFNVVNSSTMVAEYLHIIDLLKAKGFIDGIGVQSHFFSIQGTPPDTIRSNLDKLAETGLPIYSSEMDIKGDDSMQLADFKTIFPIFWEHPSVAGVTLWGWLEGYTWQDSTYLIRKDGTERPALQWLREYVAGSAKAALPLAPSDENMQPFSLFGTLDGWVGVHVRLPGILSLRIVDLQGRTVFARMNRFFTEGKHTLFSPGGKLPAGVYQAVVKGTAGAMTRTIRCGAVSELVPSQR
jgi:endo-1,4-beta-xylanase